MKRPYKEIAGRIFLGIIVLVVLAIVIIPKPQKNTSLAPSDKSLAQNKVVKHFVTLTSKGFNPQTITIKKGEFVIWQNQSGKVASVNSADHPTHKLFPVLNLGLFNNGTSTQTSIPNTGEFRYHNHLIPSQTGTIIVTEK